MLKKLIKIIKIIFIGGCWTYVYIWLANRYFVSLWNFNLFSHKSWQTISLYWDNGGVIKTGKDYLLLFSLFFLLPLWLIIGRFCLRCNYTNILLLPYKLYNEHVIKSYNKNDKRITIKNMGTASVKIEDEIEQKAKPKTKIATDEGVNKIRDAVAQKINSVSHQ